MTDFNDRRRAARRLLQPHEESPLPAEYLEHAQEVLAKSSLPLEGLHVVNVRPSAPAARSKAEVDPRESSAGFLGAFTPRARDLHLPQSHEMLPLVLKHEWSHVIESQNSRSVPALSMLSHARSEGRGDRSYMEQRTEDEPDEPFSGYFKFSQHVNQLRSMPSQQFQEVIGKGPVYLDFDKADTGRATVARRAVAWVDAYTGALNQPRYQHSPTQVRGNLGRRSSGLYTLTQ